MFRIRPIFLIAGNTITGVLRGVVLNVLLVLAALMIIFFTSSESLEPGAVRQVITDAGLAIIAVLGAMIAILTGFTMIPSEVESRTLYPVLSKPVRRWQFVLGKFLGAAGINGITVAMLAVLFFVVYFLKVRVFDPRLLLGVVMIYAQLVILSGLIIFFSTFMSWIGTIIVSMVVWFLGNYSQFLSDMANHTGSTNQVTTIVFQVVQKLIPNFQAMDLRYAIVQQQLTSPSELMHAALGPLGIGALYLVSALALATLVFNYREL
jgi:ABC-type transport system involved in multi-copper enzyme maturation permease subunit